MIPIVVQPEVIKDLADCIVDVIQNKIDWNSIDWQAVAENQIKNDWIPVSERMPEEIINPVTNDFYEYICTFHLDDVDDVRVYKFGNGHWWSYGQMMDKYVTAWMPRPEPYTEKKITNFYTKRFNEVN